MCLNYQIKQTNNQILTKTLIKKCEATLINDQNQIIPIIKIAIQFHSYINCLKQMKKTQTIGQYQFDLNTKIILYHPANKFWEVISIGTNNTYRVGKLKGDQQIKVQEVSKTYSKESLAKETARNKILEKLTKGYFSKDADSNKSQQKKELIKRTDKKQQKKDEYQGEYYQKQQQATKLEVNQNRVKITRISQNGKKTGYQIRSFATNQKAIQFCIQQQTWYKSQGFTVNNRKFQYTFQDESQKTLKVQQDKGRKVASKKQDSISTRPKGHFLSITDATDDAISHRSRNNSSCKSDRSFKDDGSQDISTTGDTKLGPSTSGCIKVLLAETWSDQFDPQGMIMSEKLDGVRCFWTGTMMYSRNGNRFYPPKFFTKNWPKSQLDGQLFIGRGQFSKTISAVKKNVPIDSQWQNVNYLVFDAPGFKAPFKKRIQLMQQVIKSLDNDYIKCHFHRECNGYTDLFQQLQKVNKIQGQGLMLRAPDSYYQNRRSKSLLKVKTFHDDQATILGYKEGTGRCLGMVGALRVRNTHGIEFEVGSGLNDDLRRKPPKIGTKITYKYQEFIKPSGKPRFPTFLRVFQEKI